MKRLIFGIVLLLVWGQSSLYTVDQAERKLIELTLAHTRDNKTRAAEILGVNRNTLRAKIRSLDIPVLRGFK